MPRATFNDVTLDIPDGWQDNTVVNLVGPATEHTGLPTANPTVGDAPNIVIKRDVLTTGNLDLASLGTAQEEMMRVLMPELQVTARGEAVIGPTRVRAITREYAFKGPTRALAQVQVYWLVGPAFYVLCGTASVGQGFAEVKKRVSDVLATLVTA